MLTQSPLVNVPVVVVNLVVFPERVPTVGATPAPPPITGKLAVNAPDDAIVPEAVNAGIPPDVPEVIPVPPCATVTAAAVLSNVPDVGRVTPVLPLDVNVTLFAPEKAIVAAGTVKVPVVVETISPLIDVAKAAPNVGVTNVGEVVKATEPVPLLVYSPTTPALLNMTFPVEPPVIVLVPTIRFAVLPPPVAVMTLPVQVIIPPQLHAPLAPLIEVTTFDVERLASGKTFIT